MSGSDQYRPKSKSQHSPVSYVLEAEIGFLTDGTARARWNPNEHEVHLHLYRCRLLDFVCLKELMSELSMTECNARSEQWPKISWSSVLVNLRRPWATAVLFSSLLPFNASPTFIEDMEHTWVVGNCSNRNEFISWTLLVEETAVTPSETSASVSAQSAETCLIDEDVLDDMEDVRAPSAADTSNDIVGSPMIGVSDIFPSVTEIWKSITVAPPSILSRCHLHAGVMIHEPNSCSEESKKRNPKSQSIWREISRLLLNPMASSSSLQESDRTSVSRNFRMTEALPAE